MAPKVDCHVHVFDPERFPYAADTFYRPSGCEIGTASLLRHVMDAHEVRYALLVGPNSGYFLDNRCLLHALAQGAGRFKAVAVVPNDTGAEALQELKSLGVVGIALNVALLGVDFYRNIGPLLQRLRDLDMWAQVQVEGDQLVRLKPMLVDSGVRLLFDHCGRPFPAEGVRQPGFVALLSLAGTDRAVVKLSSLTKCSDMPFPHPDAWPYVRALIETYTPRALVWASDWPFLRARQRIDYGPLITLMDRLVPDAEARHAIFWETPIRFFGFDASLT
jgi:predicted TIM-barrel fold metal-dependent hydrolase